MLVLQIVGPDSASFFFVALKHSQSMKQRRTRMKVSWERTEQEATSTDATAFRHKYQERSGVNVDTDCFQEPAALKVWSM